jgi:hypothetical protein
LGELRPVAFFSRKLAGSPGKGQVGWSVREKETYAIVLMLLKFRSWLAGSCVFVKVLTDHQSLKSWYNEDLTAMLGSVGRRGRWHEFMSQFNLVVCYVEGKHQKVSDALSRWAYPASTDQQDSTFHGDLMSQRYADLCEHLENVYDGLTDFRPLARCVVDPDSCVIYAVLSDSWDYAGGRWATTVLSLGFGNDEPGFYMESGHLICGDKVCVPSDKTEEVVAFYHSFGHPGQGKLLGVVQKRCLFECGQKSLVRVVGDVVRHCQVCQAVKPRSGPMPPGSMDFWPIPSDIFHSLSMDFLTLPDCLHDGVVFDYCFVIVDRLSGYILAIPCSKKGLTARKAAGLFLQHCVNLMGVPVEIVCDNDNLITSEFFSDLCDLIGIAQHRAVIYRPKGNGRAERAVKSVVSVLRLTLLEKELAGQWVRLLPWCLFLQNSLPGVVCGYSPHRIVFGRDLSVPGDLVDLVRRVPSDSDTFFSEIVSLREKAQRVLSAKHDLIRKQFMKSHSSVIYSPGERVWVRVLPKDHRKLSPLWMGPCQVLKGLEKSTYLVSTPHGEEVLHSDSFKPYLGPLDGVAVPFAYYRPDRPLDQDSDDFVVDKILRHEKKGGTFRWLVQWKGFPDPTWETAKSFVGDVQIDWWRYNRKHGIAVSLSDLPVPHSVLPLSQTL